MNVIQDLSSSKANLNNLLYNTPPENNGLTFSGLGNGVPFSGVGNGNDSIKRKRLTSAVLPPGNNQLGNHQALPLTSSTSTSIGNNLVGSQLSTG